MNWAYYLTTIGVIIAAAGFLHQLLVKRKEATIETLTEKNKWLEDRLEQSQSNSPDALVEKLARRISIQEAELERLSKDHIANESLIRAKEEELEKTKELQSELENEIGRHLKEYSELESKLDLCPYCGSQIEELTYIEDESNSGTLRAYLCGYSEIDGYLRYFCPTDPDYPQLDEFDFRTKESGSGWTCYTKGKTLKAIKVPTYIFTGTTEEEARSNAIAAYRRRKPIK
jgi:hypothetical protein